MYQRGFYRLDVSSTNDNHPWRILLSGPRGSGRSTVSYELRHSMVEGLVCVTCTMCELRLDQGDYLQREVLRHNGIVWAHYLVVPESLNQDVYDEGFGFGYFQGFDEGRFQGYYEGFNSDAYNSGFDEGRYQGYNEGRAHGLQ